MERLTLALELVVGLMYERTLRRRIVLGLSHGWGDGESVGDGCRDIESFLSASSSGVGGRDACFNRDAVTDFRPSNKKDKSFLSYK